MSVLQFFWALGAILEASLALVVMTNMDDDVNWRWLLGLSAIPVGLMSFIFPVSISCVCTLGNVPYCAKTVDYDNNQQVHLLSIL